MEKKIDQALSSSEEDGNQILFALVDELSKSHKGRVRQVVPSVSALKKLLNCLADNDRPIMTRRWTALLLQGCAQEYKSVRGHILRLEEEISALSPLVFHDREDLRIAVAALIASIASTTDNLHKFWPGNSFPSASLLNLPMNLDSQRSWAANLSNFYTQVSLEHPSSSNETRPMTFLAQAIELDNVIVRSFKQAFHCIIHDGLTAILNPPSHKAPFFLDIPLQGIESVLTSQKLITDSQDKSQEYVHALELRLAGKAANATLNAERRRTRLVKVYSVSNSDLKLAANILDKALDTNSASMSSLTAQFDATRTPGRLGDHRTLLVLASEAALLERTNPAPVLPRVISPPAYAWKDAEIAGKTVHADEPERRSVETIEKLSKEPLPREGPRESQTQLRREKVDQRKALKGRRVPGKLADLSSLLSPEPDEPKGSLHPPSSVLRGSNLRAWTKAGSVASNAPDQDQIVAQVSTSVPVKKPLDDKGTTKTRTAPIKKGSKIGIVQDSEEVYDVPVSESEAATKNGKSKIRKPNTRAKKPPGRKPAKAKRKAGIPQSHAAHNEDDYEASQQIDNSANSTYASKRFKALEGRAPSRQRPGVSAKAEDGAAEIIAASVAIVDQAINEDKGVTKQELEVAKALARSSQQPKGHLDGDGIAIADILEFEAACVDYNPLDPIGVLAGGAPKELSRRNDSEVDAANPSREPIELSSDKSLSDNEDDAEVGEKTEIIQEANLLPSGLPRKIEKLPSASSVVIPDHAPKLVDEISTRKASLVSFTKTGPRNQGRSPALRHSATTPRLRSPQLPYSSPPGTRISRMRVEAYSRQDRPLLKHSSPGTAYGIQASRSVKRSQRSQLSSSVRKRTKFSQEELEDGNFIPIEDVETPAQPQPLYKPMGPNNQENIPFSKPKTRQASQRSVQVTEDGSPVPDSEQDIYGPSTSPAPAEDAAPHVRPSGKESVLARLSGVISAHNTTHDPTRTLSSNSKPQPLSPFIESQAMSGFAPKRVVEALLRRTIEPADNPFPGAQDDDNRPQTAFLQRIARYEPENDVRRRERHNRRSVQEVVYVQQSEVDASSSDSIAEHEVMSPGFLMRANEMAWEAALQPRHRSILYLLKRTSRELVKHIVDSETAVNHVIDNFVEDADYIVQQLRKDCIQRKERDNHAALIRQRGVVKKYRDVERKLQHSRARLRGQAKANIEVWKQAHDTASQIIRQLEVS